VLPAGGVGGSGRNGTEIHWRYRKTYMLFYPRPFNVEESDETLKTEKSLMVDE